MALTASELRAQDTLIVNLSLNQQDQTIFSEEKSAGYYDLSVPASSLPTGTYFFRLETKNKTRTEKIIKGGE